MRNNVIELQKILYPEKYPSEYIYTYPTFNQELKQLLNKSGYESSFKIKYHKSLRFLENLRKNCVLNPNLFEQLINSNGLYSIILKGEMNIRILFDFETIDQKEIAMLYTCFIEIKTKDYNKAIQQALLRKAETLSKGGK